MSSEPESATPPPVRRLGPAAAGLFSFLAFSSLPLLPILGAFVALLTPLPLVHLMALGLPSVLGWGWVAVALVGAALIWQTPWLIAATLGYLLLGAWPALAVEMWLRRSWRTGRWTALVTLVALAVIELFLVVAFFPTNPAEALGRLMARTSGEAAEVLRTIGGGAGSGGEDLFAQAIQLTAYLVPAAGAMYVLTSALWLRPRLPLLGLGRGAEPFFLYSSEEWLPAAFALGGLGWVFAAGVLKWLATNLFVTVLGLYFLHGLAIIHFYLGRRLGGNRWVRLAVVLFALQIPVAVVLSALGLTDTFVPLRRGGQVDGRSEP